MLISSLKFLQNEVKGSCDAYLDELRKELEAVAGKKVSDSTVWCALRRSGYTMKKVSSGCVSMSANLIVHVQLTKIVIERNELKHEEFRQHMALSYLPDQLVFVDESACDRRTTLSRACMGYQGATSCPQGFLHTRKTVSCLAPAPPLLVSHKIARSFSILPALSLDGFLFASIIEGSYNAALFAEFIETLLEHMNPFPERNLVLVMDNCRIHKSPLIVEMIERRCVITSFIAALT